MVYCDKDPTRCCSPSRLGQPQPCHSFTCTCTDGERETDTKVFVESSANVICTTGFLSLDKECHDRFETPLITLRGFHSRCSESLAPLELNTKTEKSSQRLLRYPLSYLYTDTHTHK